MTPSIRGDHLIISEFLILHFKVRHYRIRPHSFHHGRGSGKGSWKL